jgi:hypothetical protein
VLLLWITGASSLHTMSEFEDEHGVFNIALWMSSTGISERGVKAIDGNQINDLRTLLLFTDAEVEQLKLNVGDTLRFKAGIKDLLIAENKPPALLDASGKVIVKPVEDVKSKVEAKGLTLPSGERVFSLHEVEQLLAGRSAVVAGGEGGLSVSKPVSDVGSSLASLLSSDPVINASLSSLLSKPADTTVSQVRDLMRDLLNFEDVPVNSRGEKVLLPINFLSCIRGTQDSDEIVHSGKGLNLVLQTTLNRARPEKLTTGQWVAANARIMNKLIVSGKLTSTTLTDYLEYIRKIGDLLQLYTPGSVFLLDHNHRVDVHESTIRRWSDIDCTLENAHLVRKEKVQSYAQQGSSKSGASNSNNGGAFSRRALPHVNAPCWAFNSPEGCRFSKERCRYNHVESSDANPRQGSYEKSSYEKAPRFQKGGVRP